MGRTLSRLRRFALLSSFLAHLGDTQTLLGETAETNWTQVQQGLTNFFSHLGWLQMAKLGSVGRQSLLDCCGYHEDSLALKLASESDCELLSVASAALVLQACPQL